MGKEYNFSRGNRGPVIKTDPNKVRITIRIDADIVDYFKEQVHKAGGGNYQTMINSALRECRKFVDVVDRVDLLAGLLQDFGYNRS